MTFPYIAATDKDLRRRGRIAGVGVNDAPYLVQPIIEGKKKVCPFYQTWASMLWRLKRRKAYADTTVCEEWHYFMCFREWAQAKTWRGRVLDKDLLSGNNKVYSPETCVFILPATNSLISGLPDVFYTRGVDKHQGRWRALCGRKYLGHYDTEQEAVEVRCRAQAARLAIAATMERDPRARVALSALCANTLKRIDGL